MSDDKKNDEIIITGDDVNTDLPPTPVDPTLTPSPEENPVGEKTTNGTDLRPNR
jgi:hypothetical protein